MKRLLLALTIATASLVAFTSCTKEYITEEHYNMVPAKTMVYERPASSWQVNGKQKYLDLQVPELTQYFKDQGVVTIAMSENNEDTFQAIPATIGAVSFWFDYTVGSVRIYAEDPILEDGVEPAVPTNAVFKISLFDADFVE